MIWTFPVNHLDLGGSIPRVSLPDLVNGCFEASGGWFIYQSIKKLYRDKSVRGVSWKHVAFFSTWGYWNLFYYPHLDQWLSFAGGVGIVITNTIWLLQIAYYLGLENKTVKS